MIFLVKSRHLLLKFFGFDNPTNFPTYRHSACAGTQTKHECKPKVKEYLFVTSFLTHSLVVILLMRLLSNKLSFYKTFLFQYFSNCHIDDGMTCGLVKSFSALNPSKHKRHHLVPLCEAKLNLPLCFSLILSVIT